MRMRRSDPSSVGSFSSRNSYRRHSGILVPLSSSHGSIIEQVFFEKEVGELKKVARGVRSIPLRFPEHIPKQKQRFQSSIIGYNGC